MIQAEMKRELTTQFGASTSFGHHGELIQGIFSKDGHEYRALVTLPFRYARSTAKFFPNDSNHLKINDSKKIKSKKALELTAAYLNMQKVGGYLHIESNIPIGKGIGSSTTDVVSTIKAFADSFGHNLLSSEVAKIAVEAERASDSIMFNDQIVLFAQRDAKVLDYLHGELPPMKVVGVDTGTKQKQVDTLKIKLPNYTSDERTTFNLIYMMLKKGIKEHNVSLIGKAATASALINQKYLKKPNFEQFMELKKEFGSVGIQVAHSGTVIGFIFDGKSPSEEPIAELRKKLKLLGYDSYEFQV